MSSSSLHDPANQAPGVQIGPTPMIKSFHRLKKEKKVLKSSSLKPRGPQLVYI